MATLESFFFFEQPVEELLEEFTKEHIGISEDKKLKKTIKDSIKTELITRGILKSPPTVFVMPASPVLYR